ncbi:MAG: hypothetical protein EA365_02170, partial [Gloeocapsa sp. DLM2.Bin57]
KQTKELQQQNKTHQEANQQLQAKLDSQTQVVNQLESERNHLQTTITELQQQNQTHQEANQQLQAKLDSQTKQTKELQQQNKTHQETNQQLQTQLDSQNQRIKQLEGVEEFQQRLVTDTYQYKQHIASLQQQLDQQRELINKLQQNISESRTLATIGELYLNKWQRK